MEHRGLELEEGRQAFERGAWKTAYDAMVARRAELDARDLWRLGLAAYMLGDDAEFVRTSQQAQQAYLEAGDRVASARCAFWLGFYLGNRGDVAQASGWLSRAARLLEDCPAECAERGLLLLPVAFRQLMAGDAESALRAAADAVAIGKRSGDVDLLSLALHLQGRVLIRKRRVDDGLALLDEAMVAVAAGEVSPHVTGLVYCSVIGACREVLAVERAHEWTAALGRWCESQPDMVPYAGECRVYRAEIFFFHGEWSAALEEAERAAEHLEGGPQARAAALAHYQRGEVFRLRSDFAVAEESYRTASRLGREPYPGLALLRLAQGDGGAACAAIRRALAERPEGLERARLLPAAIEILLAVGELAEARRLCEELGAVGAVCAPGFPETVFAQATGAIELAAGNATAALAPLRRASRDWQTMGAPYDKARVRELIGLACLALGDEDGAMLELDAARAEFERLGAATDLTRLELLTRRAAPSDGHGLTPREREVLARVATGRTNRAIARDLTISEKTVARHVANIFTKLGLTSRAAATAYAFKHDLVDPSA